MANEYVRKEYAGGAVETVLSGGIDENDTSITLADGSTMPTGAHPFVLSIGRDTPTEEKVLCSARASNVVTVLERGYDGTTAVAHGSGATVAHVLDANTIEQVNRWANTPTDEGEWAVRGGSGLPVVVEQGADGTIFRGTGGVPEFGVLEAADFPAGVIATAAIAASAVTAVKIATGAVETTKIPDDAITAAKIAAGAVTSTKLGANAVTATKVADGAIETTKIAASAVTNAKVHAAAAIAASKLLGVMTSPDGTNWQIKVATSAPVGTPAANEIVLVYTP